MPRIFHILYSLFIGLPILLGLIVVHFFVGTLGMWFYKDRAAAQQAIAVPFIRVIFLANGIRINIEGSSHVPKSGPVIFVANHTSQFDIPTMMMAVPIHFSFISKEELARVPFLGWSMKLQKHFFIFRAAGKRLAQQYQLIEEAVKSGRSLFVFPEGTRSRDGQLGVFKSRFFKMAISTETTIIPVRISGAYEVLPKGKTIPNTGTITVHFAAPITTRMTDDPDLLMEQAKAAILAL